MSTIRQILARKPDVYTIGPEATVFEALSLMAAKNVGALPVVAGGAVVGMFSERDYARKVILVGKSSRKTLVHEIMTPKVVWVTPERSTGECMALMTEKRIRHLPVIEDGALVGVISIGDVVRDVVDEQRFTIHQLENYITSGG